MGTHREPRRAKKSLGQNFLIDGNQQRKIVAALDAGPADEVIEIGPGRGALTRHLAGAVGRLALIELDDALAADLSREYAATASVDVVHADVLDVKLADVVAEPSRALVIGNIPYNITTPIIFRLLERPRPRRIVLMVQEEVADRIVAPVGEKSYGALSVGVRTAGRVEKLFRVRRGSFRPVPGVDSAVIRIDPRIDADALDPEVEAATRKLVRSAFQWRRKQLGTILRTHPEIGLPAERVEELLASMDIDPRTRPERLAPDQFVALGQRL